MADQVKVNDILQEAISAAQAAEQQGLSEGPKKDQQENTKLAEAFKAAAPLLKGLEVLKKRSHRSGFLRRPLFNYKAEEKKDYVRISTTVRFFKIEACTLSITVYSGGRMTMLFNDPGTYKGGAITTHSQVLSLVAKSAAKKGLIG